MLEDHNFSNIFIVLWGGVYIENFSELQNWIICSWERSFIRSHGMLQLSVDYIQLSPFQNFW